MSTRYSKKKPWTPEEVTILIEASKSGIKPAQIAKQFPDRTIETVRAKYWTIRSPDSYMKAKREYKKKARFATIQISSNMDEWLEKESLRRNLSKSSLIRNALKAYRKQIGE